MRRISTATKVVDKFGVGKHGFTNGNALTGVPATDLEDAFYDHLQEEICGIIEASGGVVDGSTRTQLLNALNVLFATKSQAFGIGQTWQVVTRTLGTTYYNSTSKPIFVMGTFYNTVAGSTFAATLAISGVVADSQSAVVSGGIGTTAFCLKGVVPPGGSYVYTGTQANFSSSSEAR